MADEKDTTIIDIPEELVEDQPDKVVDPDLGSVVSKEEELLTPEQQEVFDSTLESEIKFGDQNLKAGLAGVARGVTLGFSDQAMVKSGAVNAETLRELSERNKAASIAGEVVGTVAPLLATGGTGVAAKGALTAGAAVRGAAKAGQVVEKITAKALQKAIAQTGNKKMAKEVIRKSLAKSAGSAVEGAFYGTGQLVSEDALGTAEFNAENLLSSAGAGAVLGGAAGSLFGAGEAFVPVISKGAKTVGGKAKDVAKKFVNREDAALDAVGVGTAKAKSKFIERHPKMAKVLPDWLIEKAKLKRFSGSEDISKGIKRVKNESGERIGTILKDLDEAAKLDPSLLPEKELMFRRIANKIDDEVIQPKINSPGNRGKLKRAERLRDDYRKIADSKEPLNVATLQKLKSDARDLINYGRKSGTREPFEEKAARVAANLLKEEIDGVANQVALNSTSPKLKTISKDLLEANEDFHIATTIEESAFNETFKGAKLGMTDYLLGVAGFQEGAADLLGVLGVKKVLQSNLVRNLKILSGIEKQAAAVDKKMTSGMNNFFSGLKKTYTPASTKVLLSSGFSKDYEELRKPKKPDSKQKAYENMSKNLEKISTDPNFLLDRVGRNVAQIRTAAPETAAAIEATTVKASEFLSSKMPKPGPGRDVLFGKNKPFMPSELELAKFERYLQVIDDPLSIIDDLESGTMTREHVEALNAVYPELYQKLRNTAMEKIVEEPESVDYTQRIQLGILLDLPSDESLIPQNVAKLQQNFAEDGEEGQQEKSQGAVNTTVGGLKDMNKSNRSETGSSLVVNRRVDE